MPRRVTRCPAPRPEKLALPFREAGGVENQQPLRDEPLTQMQALSTRSFVLHGVCHPVRILGAILHATPSAVASGHRRQRCISDPVDDGDRIHLPATLAGEKRGGSFHRLIRDRIPATLPRAFPRCRPSDMGGTGHPRQYISVVGFPPLRPRLSARLDHPAGNEAKIRQSAPASHVRRTNKMALSCRSHDSDDYWLWCEGGLKILLRAITHSRTAFSTRGAVYL